MTKQGKDNTVEIAWKQAQDCCATPAGRLPPTIDLNVGVGRGGAALTVSAEIGHACGVDSYTITVQITEGQQTWTWEKTERLRDIPESEELDLAWGPNVPDNLPVQQFDWVRVDVVAISTCRVAANAHETVALF